MYGQELLEEMEIEAAVEYLELLRDIRNGIWTMKDGTRIPICQMTLSHLKNTIRLLERRSASRDEVAAMWLPTMRGELKRRTSISGDPILDEMSYEEYWG